MRILLVGFLLTLTSNSFGLKAIGWYETKQIESKYQERLLKVVAILKKGKQPSVKIVENSIPQNSEEAHLFFRLDYDKSTSKEYQQLFDIIVNLSSSGKYKILKKFIMLSEFVDGYFAEDYFGSAEGVFKAQTKLYCEIYKSIPETSKKRLKEYGLRCN